VFGRSKVKFFGFNAEVSDVVFVIDISGSMVGEGKSEADYRRIEQEVVKSIKALDSKSRFGVIAFAGQAHLFAEALSEASDTNKQAAIKWLVEQGPYGEWRSRGGKHRGTFAALALDKALQLKPDTIFFASDGAPTDLRGQAFFDKIGDSRKEFASKAKILALSYKAGKAGDFMKELASMTGGKFVEVE